MIVVGSHIIEIRVTWVAQSGNKVTWGQTPTPGPRPCRNTTCHLPGVSSEANTTWAEATEDKLVTYLLSIRCRRHEDFILKWRVTIYLLHWIRRNLVHFVQLGDMLIKVISLVIFFQAILVQGMSRPLHVLPDSFIIDYSPHWQWMASPYVSLVHRKDLLTR